MDISSMKTLLELQAIQSIGNSQSTSQSVSSEQSVFTELLQDLMSSSSSSLTDSENLLGYFGSLTDSSTDTASLLGSLGGLTNTSTNSLDDYLSAFTYNGDSNLSNSYYNDLLQNNENTISNYLNKDYLNTAGFTNVLAGANAYSDIIKQASETYGVPEKLIASVMKQESNYNQNAISSAGATGLMQLMPGTAKYLGVNDAKDPAQNIMGGTKYLSQLLEKFDQSIELALAAYNAGPGNVSKYGGIPPFTETKNYVNKVMNYYNA